MDRNIPEAYEHRAAELAGPAVALHLPMTFPPPPTHRRRAANPPQPVLADFYLVFPPQFKWFHEAATVHKFLIAADRAGNTVVDPMPPSHEPELYTVVRPAVETADRGVAVEDGLQPEGAIVRGEPFAVFLLATFRPNQRHTADNTTGIMLEFDPAWRPAHLQPVFLVPEVLRTGSHRLCVVPRDDPRVAPIAAAAAAAAFAGGSRRQQGIRPTTLPEIKYCESRAEFDRIARGASAANLGVLRAYYDRVMAILTPEQQAAYPGPGALPHLAGLPAAVRHQFSPPPAYGSHQSDPVVGRNKRLTVAERAAMGRKRQLWQSQRTKPSVGRRTYTLATAPFRFIAWSIWVALEVYSDNWEEIVMFIVVLMFVASLLEWRGVLAAASAWLEKLVQKVTEVGFERLPGVGAILGKAGAVGTAFGRGWDRVTATILAKTTQRR